MNSRTRIFAGNWKMNYGPKEALDYLQRLARELLKTDYSKSSFQRRNVIFPPAYALSREIQNSAQHAGIELGAQNVHWEEKGAFTGELSGSVLKSENIDWVLIAHSERRQFFGETDETAAKRFSRAAELGLNVIYCIGETLTQREQNQTEAVLSRQTQAFLEVLKKHPKTQNNIFSIAYEPVWAIGTGKTATTEQAEQAHKHIRKVVWDALGLETAQNLSILYGGSVTPENAHGLMTQPNVDGVLVGGASLKPEGFARILASL